MNKLSLNNIITINDGTHEVTLKVSDEVYNKLVKTIKAKSNAEGVELISNVTNEPKKTTKTKPVAKVTKSASKPKTTTKSKPKAKKSNDDFNYDQYVSIAKELGVYGKHGVWKCARPAVDKVMNGEATMKQAMAEVKKVIKTNGWDK